MIFCTSYDKWVQTCIFIDSARIVPKRHMVPRMTTAFISRPFNKYRATDSLSVAKLTDEVTDQLLAKEVNAARLGPLIRTNTAQRNFRAQLSVLLLDLLVCWQEGHDHWISLSMSNRGYSAHQNNALPKHGMKQRGRRRDRYNPLKVDRKIIPIVKSLAAAGLVEFKTGFLDRQTNKAFRTRIQASGDLIEIFNQTDVDIYDVKMHHAVETLELKDDQGALVNYGHNFEPKWAAASRELLSKYNNLLRRSLIDVPELEASVIPTSRQGKLTETSIAPHCPFVKRVFNNSRWDHGGRFYGGFWQNMPHRTRHDPETGEKLDLPNRSRIYINDKPCVERDFSGLHIVLLYARKGIDFWTGGHGDPYTVPDPIFPDYNRQLGKLMMLYCINANDEKKAFAALNNQLRNNAKPALKLANFREHFQQLRDKHQTIDEFFFTGVGLELQFTDSQIAESVIETFTDQEKVVLSLHDGFVVQEEDEELLCDAMDSAFSKITGLKTVRHKSEWVTAKQSYKRAMEFKTAERGYYLDAVSQLKIRRSDRYIRNLNEWRTFRQKQADMPNRTAI